MSEISSLQSAREAAGLTLVQVSAQTNIRVSVIRDLENNSVEISGGIAYARGHIRSIVRVLNSKISKAEKIDADLLVAEIEAGQSGENKKIIDQLAANNVANKPKEKKRIKFGTLAAISASFLSIGFVAQIAINNVATIIPAKEVSEGVGSVVRQDTQELKQPTGVSLVLTGVVGNSWVGLTNANGERVFSGQILAGQIATFTDPQMIRAVIGNAGALRVNINGSDIGVVGGDGEVVRLDFDVNGQA